MTTRALTRQLTRNLVRGNPRGSGGASGGLPTATYEMDGSSLPAGMALTRASDAYYQNSDGEWLLASSNTARFGYLYGSASGLICEEQVTQRIRYTRAGLGTENLTFVGGTTETDRGKANTSQVTDATAPTNNLTGGDQIWRVDNTPVGGVAELAYRGAFDVTTPLSFMIHYKHVGGSAVSVVIDDYLGTQTTIGTLDTGSGWQIGIIEGFTPGNINQILVLHVPQGTEIDICAINLQVCPQITSYIEQASTTDATRQPDEFLDATASWYDTAQGTFFLDYSDRNATAPAAIQTPLYIGDGTNNNRINLNKTTSGQHSPRVVNGATATVSVDFSSKFSISGRNKLAMIYDTNNFKFGLNGPIIHTDTTVTPPTSVTAGFGLGHYPGVGLHSSIIIHSFRYWDTVLTDGQIYPIVRNTPLVNDTAFNSALNLVGLMGQSNSSGEGGGSIAYVNTPKMITNAGALEDYSDPSDINTNALFADLSDPNAGLSYAGKICDDLMTSLGGTWGCVHANRHNTNIADWDADGATINPRLYAAIQMLLLAEKYGNLKAIVWHQGESDARDGITEAAYETDLQAIFDLLRNIFEPPYIVMSLHQWNVGITDTTEVEWTTIQSALTDIANANTYAYQVDISDLAGQSGDEVHLTPTSFETAGARIADQIEAVI